MILMALTIVTRPSVKSKSVASCSGYEIGSKSQFTYDGKIDTDIAISRPALYLKGEGASNPDDFMPTFRKLELLLS